MNEKLHGLDPEFVWRESAPFLAGLSDLFSEMDTAYGRVAEEAGFVCRGCDENCCETRFHHHTLLEIFFLLQGFGKLSGEVRQTIRTSARHYCLAMESHDAASTGRPFRKLCPISDGVFCMLYPNRPMICRLHGASWTMQGKKRLQGPGCDCFERAWQEKKVSMGGSVVPLDRTPYYRRFASLEQECRRSVRFDGKIRMTIAEILCLDEYTIPKERTP